MTLVYGDSPPEFSAEQLAEIRLLAAEKWERLHREKNGSDNPHVRDALTDRLCRLESIQEAITIERTSRG